MRIIFCIISCKIGDVREEAIGMRGRVIEKLAAVACALCLACGVMSSVVFARDTEPEPELPQEPEATFVILDPVVTETAAPTPEIVDNRTSVPLFVDGEQRGSCAVLDGILYMAPDAFLRAVGVDASGSVSGGAYTVEGGGVSISAEPGALYFICNGRYLYVDGGIPSQGGQTVLPVELLAKCLGVSAAWDRIGWTVTVRADELDPLESGDTYYADTDIYWLSRVIYAEAGNQPLEGQVAVGSVVLNRVADESFNEQNSVYDVIFAKNQFEVVINGMIYMEPDSSAVLAAKLALDGADPTGGATYFATFDFGEGYECVMWIGDHCFMREA